MLENCSLFASLGYEICLSGDVNGLCVRKCDFTGNTILSVDKQSYNSGRLRQFIEATELTVVNSLVCCKGLFTRILNDQRSTINCVLLSKQLANNVNSVFILEDGQYVLHSDHVIISTCLCNTDTKETKTMSKSKDRFFWKITDDTDWDSFQNYLESSFTADWVNKNNDINTLWSFWKTKVNGAAESVILNILKSKKLSKFLGQGFR